MSLSLHRPTRHGTRVLQKVLAGGGVAAMLVAGTAGLGPVTSGASSHREAPLIGGDPRADNTDVYAFVSPDDANTVTLLSNWIPFEEPNGGPNFYPFATDARYNINIDNDGDAIADLVYSWEFRDNIRDDSGQFLYNTGPVKSVQDQTLNFFQTYNLTVTDKDGTSKVLLTDAIAAPSHTGKASMPDYSALRNEAVKSIEGGKTFAGQADDSFFLDLRVFDLLYGTDLSEAGQDSLAGYNVNTVGLQLPKSALAAKGDAAGNPVIGVWSTTLRKGADVFSAADGAAATDGYVQVSRLGNPLVNEVVVPLKFKDAFNGLTPDKDATVQPVVDKVLEPILPALIEKIYGIPAPAAPRNDLFEIFLTGICKTCAGPDGNVALPIDLNSQQLNKDKAAKFQPSEMLRLNMSIASASQPNRLGVLAGDTQGFPNGRRLTDDVLDIAVQAVEGAAQTGKLVEALAKGDGVNQNDLKFGSTFPYVALPHSSGVNTANGGLSAGGAPSSGSAPNAAVTPQGGVAAGGGGTAGGGSTPVLPISLAVGGVMLAGAAALSVRKSRQAAV